MSLFLNLKSDFVNPSNTPGSLPKEISGGSISFAAVNWVIIGVYLFAILCIGIFFSLESKFRKSVIKTSQNYFVAPKTIPGWAAGISLFATSLSAITFLTIPSQVFGGDWVILVGAIIAPAFAPILIKYIVPFFRKLKAESAYDYIHKRFGLHLRIFISATFILYQSFRAAIIIYTPTLAISTILPQANKYAIAAVVILITIVYSYIGGIKSVIWADVFQGIFLTIGILIMIFWSMGLIDSYSTFSSAQVNPSVSSTGTGGFANSAQQAYDDGKFVANGHWIFTLLGTGIPLVFLSYIVNSVYPIVSGQDVVQRYQASRSKHDVNKAIVLNSFLSVFVGIFMFYGFGTLAYQLFSATNQVSYSVMPFDYVVPPATSTGTDPSTPYRISVIWVANNTTATYGTNIFGYVQGQGWLPLTGLINETSKNINLPDSLSYLSNKNWQDLSINDIKQMSMGYSNEIDNGSIVQINSIVSNYQDFNKNYGVISNSNVVPYFIATILPVGVSGLIIAAIMAAGQSSISSSLNASSHCFVNDILKIYYPNLSDHQKLIIGKIVTAVIGIFAFLISMVLIATNQDSIFLFFNSIVGLFGAATLAIFFMGMFGSYIRNKAAISAMWAGMIVAIISFLLSYQPFLTLVGVNKIYINNLWVNIFASIATYAVAFIFQFIENLIKYASVKTQLVSYSELTWLGKKLKVSNQKIKTWSRFGMHNLLAKNCVFEIAKNNNNQAFDYQTIDNGNWTLNKWASNLYLNKKISERTIIWLNRFGWAWFLLRYDTPRDDLAYWDRIKNNTLVTMTKDERLIDLGENSYNWDMIAYQRYVKNLYKSKLRSKDIKILEQQQLSFDEFQKNSSYDRYLFHNKLKNILRIKKYKINNVSKEVLVKAQNDFMQRNK